MFIPVAEVVSSPLSILRTQDPVLGATAEAETDVRALEARLREPVHLVHPERTIAFHEFGERRFEDVAEPVVRIGVTLA